MKLREYMKEQKKLLDAFSVHWHEMNASAEDKDEWPMEMSLDEWDDQLVAFVEKSK